MKNWIVASYKINELKRLESNLLNQKFDYYLPKITTKKTKSVAKVEVLFPGYIFIKTTYENYPILKYTKGIRNIVKFGNNIPFISNNEIKAIQTVEESSKLNPLSQDPQIGQDVFIAKGSFKGSMVKICSLPSKDRVGVLLSFLGSMREVFISEQDLIY